MACRLSGHRERIIPALAGNTHGAVGDSQQRWDHPRSRGEYMDRRKQRNGNAGSSPLSRGIPAMVSCWLRTRRIIPALAGNTLIGEERPPRHSDHPRSRGEYPPPPPKQHGVEGSSPLSRGIRDHRQSAGGDHRIIPALAGNTQRWPWRATDYWDHPRSRGEYGSFSNTTGCGRGSSPLSRGIRREVREDSEGNRIIPALAGNTL